MLVVTVCKCDDGAQTSIRQLLKQAHLEDALNNLNGTSLNVHLHMTCGVQAQSLARAARRRAALSLVDCNVQLQGHQPRCR